jgi:hypothetical protein
LRLLQVRLEKVYIREVDAGEVGAGEVGAGEVGAGEVGAGEVANRALGCSSTSTSPPSSERGDSCSPKRRSPACRYILVTASAPETEAREIATSRAARHRGNVAPDPQRLLRGSQGWFVAWFSHSLSLACS